MVKSRKQRKGWAKKSLRCNTRQRAKQALFYFVWCKCEWEMKLSAHVPWQWVGASFLINNNVAHELRGFTTHPHHALQFHVPEMEPRGQSCRVSETRTRLHWVIITRALPSRVTLRNSHNLYYTLLQSISLSYVHSFYFI